MQVLLISRSANSYRFTMIITILVPVSHSHKLNSCVALPSQSLVHNQGHTRDFSEGVTCLVTWPQLTIFSETPPKKDVILWCTIFSLDLHLQHGLLKCLGVRSPNKKGLCKPPQTPILLWQIMQNFFSVFFLLYQSKTHCIFLSHSNNLEDEALLLDTNTLSTALTLSQADLAIPELAILAKRGTSVPSL